MASQQSQPDRAVMEEPSVRCVKHRASVKTTQGPVFVRVWTDLRIWSFLKHQNTADMASNIPGMCACTVMRCRMMSWRATVSSSASKHTGGNRAEAVLSCHILALNVEYLKHFVPRPLDKNILLLDFSDFSLCGYKSHFRLMNTTYSRAIISIINGPKITR